MKTFFRNLSAAFLALISASVMAQFSTDVSGGGAGGTKMQIEPQGGGKAMLTLSGVKVVYLNQDPKIDGVKPQKDVSGKGNVWIVDPRAAQIPGGAEVCLSGVGRGGYAVVDGIVDKTKVSCAPLAENMQFAASIANSGGNTCVGFTWLVVKDGRQVKNTWASHPDGATNMMVKRASGETDMATVLCIDQGGNIAPPAENQIPAYKAWYTKVTAAN